MRFLDWWKTFCRTTLGAIKGAAFYRKPETLRPGAAFGHLLVLLLVLWSLPVMIGFFVGARELLAGVRDVLERRVPADAVFEVRDGRFTNTLSAPLVLSEHGVDIIVNTATTTLELGANPGIAVGSETIMVRDDASGTATFPFAEMRGVHMRVDAKQLSDGFGRRAPLFVLVGALLLLVLGTGLIAFSYASLALFHAGILWLASKFLKKPLRFSQTFAIALYAACAPMLIRTVMAIFGANAATLALFAYWILLGAILYDHAKGTWAAAPPPVPNVSDPGSAS